MRYFLFILIILFSQLSAEIREITTLDAFDAILPSIRKNEVVLFDFQDTLLLENDALLSHYGKHCLYQKIKAQAPYLLPEKIQDLLSIILLERKLHLIEDKSLNLIQQLKRKKIKSFVLTSLKKCSLGRIPKMEEWRKEELRRYGFDFREVFPSIPILEFNEFSNKKSPPIFTEGVLFSRSVSKGEVLAHFFHKINFYPQSVIFVDNSLDHHHSVQKWMNKLGIKYLGLYYRAAEKQLKKVDEAIAFFQIQYLIKNEKWLSDEEAASMIQWE